MFPEMQDIPSIRFKPFIFCFGSLNVLLQLGHPIFLIGLGNVGVLGAAMPKAAINEDSQFLRWKGNVDLLLSIVYSKPHAF